MNIDLTVSIAILEKIKNKKSLYVCITLDKVRERWINHEMIDFVRENEIDEIKI